MFKSIAKKSAALALAIPLVAQAQTKALSLEDRVAELEAGASLQNLKVGGFLETYANVIKFEDPSVASAYRETTNRIMRLRAGLDLNVEVSPRTKFYSRLAASKFLNTTTGSVTPAAGFVSNDASQGRDWTGSQIYLEKAYADINITPSWVFSFGRLPTVDGPPLNYQVNRPRLGTYPTLARNSILDGVALTYNTTVGEGHELTGRVIYTPVSYVNVSAGTGLNYVVPPVFDGKEDSTTDITALMLEYKKQGGSLAKSFNVVYMGTKSGQLRQSGAAYGTTGNLNWSYFLNNITFLMEGVANSNFDFSVSHTMSEINNDGPGLVAAGGVRVGFGGLADESIYSQLTLLAAKYNFNNNNTAVGAEYLTAGKNYFLYNPGHLSLTNYYNTPGNYHNVYVVHRFLSELTGRFGVAQQNYNWTAASLGPGSSSDRKITTYEAMLRLDF